MIKNLHKRLIYARYYTTGGLTVAYADLITEDDVIMSHTLGESRKSINFSQPAREWHTLYVFFQKKLQPRYKAGRMRHPHGYTADLKQIV